MLEDTKRNEKPERKTKANENISAITKYDARGVHLESRIKTSNAKVCMYY